ncbi:MAG: FGGY family carbohydrate kinase, partial [Paracoccaceae bacterium]
MPEARIIIGIDAGTSVIKAVAFQTDGRQLAVSSVVNRYQQGAGGAVTQSLQQTWKDCAAALRELGDQLPGLAARVLAISVTAQGDGTWLVGKGNR